MNQILVTNEENGATTREIKPIIRFFCIVCIVFALILIICGGFSLHKNLSTNKDFPKPEFTSEKEGSHLNVKLTGEIGINKYVYSWNGGNETTLSGDGKKKVIFQIEMPQGENKLSSYVIDVEGNKTKYEDITVTFTEEEDTVKPVIALESVAGKLQITASDDRELDYLTYKWEDGEEVRIEVSEDKTLIQQSIDVEKGTKKITLKAVDKAGNEQTASQTIIGSNGPTIKASLSNGNFVIKVTDEFGITKIEYTHNEEPHTVEDLPEGATEFEFKVPLKEGENYLKIDAYENGIMTEYKCKKTK